MKLRAHFSWTAPRDLFFLSPQTVSQWQICEMIKRDAEQTLRDRPALEALEDFYNLSGATEFTIDGKTLPHHGHGEDEPGQDRYCLDVEIEGQLQGASGFTRLAENNRCELWNEIAKRGDIIGATHVFWLASVRSYRGI